MGVYPKPFLERIEPSVDRLLAHVEANSDHRQPEVATEGSEIVPESERRAEGDHGEEHGEEHGDDAEHGDEGTHSEEGE
jgi:NADH-quinone oxidoreductase subunit M